MYINSNIVITSCGPKKYLSIKSMNYFSVCVLSVYYSICTQQNTGIHVLNMRKGLWLG